MVSTVLMAHKKFSLFVAISDFLEVTLASHIWGSQLVYTPEGNLDRIWRISCHVLKPLAGQIYSFTHSTNIYWASGIVAGYLGKNFKHNTFSILKERTGKHIISIKCDQSKKNEAGGRARHFGEKGQSQNRIPLKSRTLLKWVLES